MNTVRRLFRKYLCNSIIILVIFLLINLLGAILFLAVVKTHTIDSDREIDMIANEISLNQDGGIKLSEEAKKLLDEKLSWAMILNDIGEVIWEYQMPAELPRKYSVSDVAGFSRWYLKDYPVLVHSITSGLLVVGYQPDDMLGISMVKLYYVTDSGFLYASVLGVILLILMNIALVMFLFLKNTRRIENEIVPIMRGIEDMSKGVPINLSCEGELEDITYKLNKASELLKNKEETRAEWINGVSHDVRTPLSLIMGYAGEIKEDCEVNGTIRKRADIIISQTEKIKRLVTDLNLVTKLESSLQPIRKEKLNLPELGRMVLADFINNGLEDKYELEYKVSVLTENDFFVEGDRYLLRRMLENLIQNSISHNEGGCKIILSIKELEDSYQITVADDGTGVSTEKMLHLNLIPDTDDNYMENGEAAHGYGLKLVRQIVKAHQGEIMFRENNPKGFCSEIWGRKIL